MTSYYLIYADYISCEGNLFPDNYIRTCFLKTQTHKHVAI